MPSAPALFFAFILVAALSPGVVKATTLYYTTQNAFLIYSGSQSLPSDLICGTLIIQSGATVTTNGYSIICANAIINHGTIDTGNPANGGAAASVGGAYTSSYAGSGGGGGGYNNKGNPGSTPSAPIVSSTNINTWYSGQGFATYLSGAGGGGSADVSGGSGSYGIYLQANTISVGTINAAGVAGTTDTGSTKTKGQNGGNTLVTGGTGGASSGHGAGTSAGGGGGGGGVVMIAYGTGGYTAGTVNAGAGAGGSATETGGAGGAGRLVTPYNYGTSAPIVVLAPLLAVSISTSVALPATLDAGSVETFYAYATGGSGTYSTYNFLVYNSATDKVIGNYLSSTNTFDFNIPSKDANNAVYANVIVYDGIVHANSILTGVLTINPALTGTPTVSQAGTTLTGGISGVSGGTTPYTYQWYSGVSPTCGSDSAISGATSLTYSPVTVGYYYCFTVTDSAAAAQSVTSSSFLVQNNQQGTQLASTTNTIIDVSQYSTFSLYNITSSSQPVTGNWLFFGSNIVAGNTIGFNLAPANVLSWEPANNIPALGAYGVACATYNGFVYCMGGQGSASLGEYSANTLVGRIQPDGNIVAWVANAQLPIPLELASCNAYNGYLYCVGGADGNTHSYSANVFVAPIQPNGDILSWSTNAIFPSAFDGGSCSVYNSYIYCSGGYTGSYFSANTYVAPLQPNGDIISWTANAPLPFASPGIQCNAYNGYLYCMGGVDEPGGGDTHLVEAAQIQSNGNVIAFVANDVLPIGVSDFSCVPFTGFIYCMGGYNSTDAVISNTFVGTILGNGNVIAWTDNAPYPVPNAYQSCTNYNNYIYCAGGENAASQYLPNVYYTEVNQSMSLLMYAQSANQILLTYSGGSMLVYNALSSSSTNTIYGTFTVNAMQFTPNGSPIVPNTLQSVTIHPTITATISPTASSPYSFGQTITFNTIATGGTGSYSYNFVIYNSITYTVIASSGSTTVNGFAYVIPSTDGGNTLVANVFVTDTGTTTPAVFNSVLSGTISLPSPPFSAGNVIASNYILTDGEYTTLASSVSGGFPSYSYQWYSGASTTCTSGSPISGATSSTYTASPSSSVYYCYKASDSGANVLYSNTIYIPVIPEVLSNTIIDMGQYSTANIAISGGTYPYSANWSWTMANVPAPVKLGLLGTWKTGNTMLGAADIFSCTTYNGYLYCGGGNTAGGYESANIMYAPILSSGAPGLWANATNTLPIGIYYSSCSGYNSYLYCLDGNGGGWFSGNTPYATIYGNGNVGPFANSNSMPTGYDGQSCVPYGGYMYCVGGIGSIAGTSFQSTNTIYAPIYASGALGTWAQSANTIPGIYAYGPYLQGMTCVAYNSYIYCPGVTGGFAGGTNVISAQLYSAGGISAWQTTNSLAANLNSNSCTGIGGYIYCGGNSQGTTIQYARIVGPGIVGTWQTTNSLAASMSEGGMTSYGNNVYTFGGQNSGSTIVNTVQYAPILTVLGQPVNTSIIGIPAATNTLTIAIDSVNAFVVNVIYAGNTYSVNTAPNTVYGVWTFNSYVSDSASNSVLLTNTITINTALGQPSISPTSTGAYSAGQSITFASYETGGTGSYSYNFLIYNSITGIQVGNYFTTSNNFAYIVPASQAGNTLMANVIVTDIGTTYPVTANSVLSGVQTIGAVPITPTISPSASGDYDAGQTITFAAYESIAGSYTYNFLIYNSITDILVGNMLTTSNTFGYTIPNAQAGNTLVANVFVSSGSYTVNSILSGIQTIYSGLETPTISPSSSGVYEVGQTITFA